MLAAQVPSSSGRRRHRFSDPLGVLGLPRALARVAGRMGVEAVAGGIERLVGVSPGQRRTSPHASHAWRASGSSTTRQSLAIDCGPGSGSGVHRDAPQTTHGDACDACAHAP